ncbi:MAG: hypothetical protein HY827_02490 [Actinobacteria bacterium]|nr:hypothetical protein [Actinomycetota bacterium]
MPRLFVAIAAIAASLALVSIAEAAVDLGRPAPYLTTSGSTCVSVFSCTFFQASDDGTDTYVAPNAGVITSYTVLTGDDFSGINAVGLRVFRPQAAGSWLLAAASASDTTLTAPGGLRVEIPTRVAVQAGDHIGIAVEFDGSTAWRYSTGIAADQVLQVSGVAPVAGTVVTPANLTSFANARVNVRAHLEGDGDGDGFGDSSQDTCPLDPTRQSVPCTPPTITGLRFAPTVFRVQPKGEILRSTRARQGSTINFTLSQPASVQFVVSRKRVGRRNGRKCGPLTRRNRGHNHCVYYEGGHHWNRASLPAGENSLPYSGRYKHGHGSALLKPGRYRLTAVPANAGGGGTDPVAITDFRIVAR